MNNKPGCLYVVATPIGNLADISDRARAMLASVDQILAEDTRHSQKLLQHYSITTPLLSLHEHNEDQRVTELLGRLQSGSQMALISDAGTPLISDPGYRLVNAAHAAGIAVRAIPGASALIAALSTAGQATDRFVFEGYLPAKQGARRERLQVLAAEPRTLVFYETPHRLRDMLADAQRAFGSDRAATLVKELTKQHEQCIYSTLAALQDWLAADEQRLRGEFVIVVAGNAQPPSADDPRPLLRSLLRHVSVKTAAAIASEVSSYSKNELYKIALEMMEPRD